MGSVIKYYTSGRSGIIPCDIYFRGYFYRSLRIQTRQNNYLAGIRMQLLRGSGIHADNSTSASGILQNQEAFATVLGTTPRVALASFAGYLFGEFSNSMILSKLKVRTGGRKLWVRTILSTLVGEGFDSVIFVTISFLGTMDTKVVLQMILFQYLFKVCYEIICTPLTYAIVRFLKRKEGIDTYDYDVRYNVIKG